jgi:FKBP-type peptidyl-prolyl cis-trans isomerase
LATQLDDDGEERAAVDLTYDLAILDVIRMPAPPADLTAPPASAHRSPTGLVSQILTRGTGATHPSPGGHVTLRFSGWKADGTSLGGTEAAGEPAQFSMSDVTLGWREALETMVAGDKVRLWVPAKLAYGEKPRRGLPAGDLVYDLELVQIGE